MTNIMVNFSLKSNFIQVKWGAYCWVDFYIRVLVVMGGGHTILPLWIFKWEPVLIRYCTGPWLWCSLFSHLNSKRKAKIYNAAWIKTQFFWAKVNTKLSNIHTLVPIMITMVASIFSFPKWRLDLSLRES